ncbi:uncharacterized protein LOC122962643 isoform X3 [Acropora millepora]|nr:uncharacterized protein LOC122962643 isoform X3 [Acropora millepora]XP_044181781.1 uncharacterized protein LOC122962643 isoform X3 [Acropora millepora]
MTKSRTFLLFGISFVLMLYLVFMPSDLTLYKNIILEVWKFKDSTQNSDRLENKNTEIPPRGAKLHLIIQFPIFNPSLGLGEKGSKERQEEVTYCLQRNLLSPHIQAIHILCETSQDHLFVKALNLNMDWKLAFYVLGHRMTYKDAFQYASLNLLGKSTIIMNADIYIHAGFENLDANILSNKTMYTLTRHEIPKNGTQCYIKDFCGPKARYIGSHDAWVFRLLAPVPDKVLREINYRPNFEGIEQVLMFHLRTSGGFTIRNPCKILHVVHHHCSQNTRIPNDRHVNGKRLDKFLGVGISAKRGLVMAPFSGL